MMLLFILFSLLSAFWFQYEFKKFPEKINYAVYQEVNGLIKLNMTFSLFLNNSTLQPKKIRPNNLFFILLPIISFISYDKPFTILFILFILAYLSVLDFFYFLTDSQYIIAIFILSLTHCLFIDSRYLIESIYTLFFTQLFFYVFIKVTQFIYKKETFGLGDILLLIALSPLLPLEKMLQLILFSCALGITFASGYFLLKKRKLTKLPFIPFVSFAFISLWLVEV